MCLTYGVTQDGERLCLFDLDIHTGQHGTDLFERERKIHTGVHLHFFPLRHARADEHDLGIRIFLLHDPGGVVHRRTGSRNIFFQVRDMFLSQLDIRRTTTGRHKRLAFRQLFFQFFGFVAGRLHRSLRHFHNFKEAQ